MAVSQSFIDMVCDLLAPVGQITVKRMFSGTGIYGDGVIFALVVDDTLYLKAGDETRARFEAEGLSPFRFKSKSGPVASSYWRAPERLFDDPDEMSAWAHQALSAARTAAAGKAAKARVRPKKR